MESVSQHINVTFVLLKYSGEGVVWYLLNFCGYSGDQYNRRLRNYALNVYIISSCIY